MRPVYIGLDTSCYATSAACVNEDGIVFQRKTMLPVVSGARGLRQSDGVFLHVRQLEETVKALLEAVDGAPVRAVAVSSKPTDEAESYMPVFLAGVASAAAIAGALHVPLIKTSHQRGHVRAALMGNEALLTGERFLALHLSGGTTDLLEVSICNGRIQQVLRIGGSDDLHIGQFVDRIGVRLGLSFPSGAGLEKLASSAVSKDLRIASSVHGVHCSFSGPESQAQRLIDAGADSCELAYGLYDCMARTIGKLINHADAEAALLCGGVSGSALFCELLKKRTNTKLFTAPAALSGDNAAGVALLAMDAWRQEHE